MMTDMVLPLIESINDMKIKELKKITTRGY